MKKSINLWIKALHLLLNRIHLNYTAFVIRKVVNVILKLPCPQISLILSESCKFRTYRELWPYAGWSTQNRTMYSNIHRILNFRIRRWLVFSQLIYQTDLSNPNPKLDLSNQPLYKKLFHILQCLWSMDIQPLIGRSLLHKTNHSITIQH